MNVLQYVIQIKVFGFGIWNLDLNVFTLSVFRAWIKMIPKI